MNAPTTLPGQIAAYLESLPEAERDAAAVSLVDTMIESLAKDGPAYAPLWNACSDIRADIRDGQDDERVTSYDVRREAYGQDRYLEGA